MVSIVAFKSLIIIYSLYTAYAGQGLKAIMVLHIGNYIVFGNGPIKCTVMWNYLSLSHYNIYYYCMYSVVQY